MSPEALEGLTAPKSVGSRELKTRLGTYLRLVREGRLLDPFEPIAAEGRPLSEAILEDRADRF